MLKAYISYVRPIVESDSSVWNPDNFICNSNNIENIQIYFTKILFYICDLTKRYYEDIYMTLFHRRLLVDLTLTYKILNGLVDVDATNIFHLYNNNCRGPKVKIRKKKCTTNAHLNYFGNRVCSSCNALPFTIISCKIVTLFREKLIHTKCINHVIVIPY